ncbi:hypothetical protein [Cyanobium sp. A1C-AMD]|uniref:hypothetical protein n=1 Tax=Cyanobium sp. A1C-AMD TaxID=2823694 RepID=UPI0020CD566D|nr:hypothetical protein [Cyanobium sp. A1C-AMD]
MLTPPVVSPSGPGGVFTSGGAAPRELGHGIDAHLDLGLGDNSGEAWSPEVSKL